MATTTLTKIDRNITVPFHLKLFYKTGSFHRLEEFSPHGELPLHVNIYTWQSCTLRELSHLLATALPDLLPDPAIGTRLSFRLIFPDSRPAASGPARYITKDLGSVVVGDGGPGILPDEEESAIVSGGIMAGSLMGEPEKTLQDARFVIGDYVCCAILPPMADGGVAPPPSGPSRGGFAGGRSETSEFGGRGGMGPRQNGFGGGYRGRGASRGGGFSQGMGQGPGAGGVPSGEWRRGERIPNGPSGGRGRGYGGGGGFGGGRGRYRE
ncbi:181a2b4e-bb20-4c29-9273-c00b72193627 [Sclerotinia trifoliorum]|uniref:181a2b4e-bb20-4c29-9273-c00b72193627 n=1 Tax=Sclerotinia trifoliorum TaxID=28548 RepID=A0A8H2VR06_9HELO|nr:181a2b4e-bb20-4c29-9273-c00b72193627 [Sclerotinia trifoliorum]